MYKEVQVCTYSLTRWLNNGSDNGDRPKGSLTRAGGVLNLLIFIDSLKLGWGINFCFFKNLD